MVDTTTQSAPDTGERPLTLYDQMRMAGFKHDEVKDFQPSAQPKPDEPAPEKPAEPQVPTLYNPPTVPAKPEPTPGVYSPEQQQNALRQADTIQDPEMRMKVKANLKREYANDAIMDGINGKAREEAIKTGVGSYSKAIEQLRDDTKISLDQKRQLVKMLTKTMWEDPRLQYGDTQQHLENTMQSIAFGENMMNLGPGYPAALDAIANGQISSARQILRMENDGSLTSKGYGMILGRFNTLEKPDKAIDTRREALAIKHITTSVMKDLDENSPIPGMKPGPRQYEMLDKTIQAFYDSIEAAGDDRAAVRKAMTLEAVTDLVDQVYPWDQRHADRISLGQNVTAAGVVIPPTVPPDARAQQAYKNIMAFPPTIADKDGKQKQVSPQGWQDAVEILRKTGNVAAFDKHFPGNMGARIVKALPYVAQAPGPTPPPTVKPVEASPGFLERIRPPAVPGPDVLTGAQEKGNKALDAAFEAFNRVLGRTLPKSEEAKK